MPAPASKLLAAVMLAPGAAWAAPPLAHAVELAQADPGDAVRTGVPLPRGADVPSPRPEALLEPAPEVARTPAPEPEAVEPDALDEALLPGRRRPGAGRVTRDEALPPTVNPGAVRPPPPQAFPTDEVPLPDRWRLAATLCADRNYIAIQAICRSPFDPYHQSVLKGDIPLDPHKLRWLPIKGEDWFFLLGAVSDTVIEPRSFPTPVGVQTTSRPGSLDVFGRSSSLVLSQTFTASASLIKGSTAFKPPEIEYRLTLAYNWNHVDVNERRVLLVEPSARSRRTDAFLGVQEAFVDYHIRNVSARYDFDSVRVGIQGFQADFRGFLFNDNQLGIRLFGNRDNNRFQYNLAAFWRVEKDTNSGLNDLGQKLRRDWVFLASVYRQDLPLPGYTSQAIVAWNRNREAKRIEVDHNGFPVRPALLGDLRPHNYDAVYLGYNGDGHFNRLNLTVSAYGVLGRNSHNFLTQRPTRIRAFFAAVEPSYDFNWMRLRLAGLYASGDRDPYDRTETGYDAIFENPIFAGADTSYWIRQTIPFAGGGRAVAVNGRNGILNSLRSSKEQGQSNFVNPGTVLAGAGADFDLTPTFRLSTNSNHLWFDSTNVLKVLRVEGSIPKAIGWDLSAAAVWRPRMNQNIVFRLSGATLIAGKGFRDLFAQSSGSKNFYSVLFNTVLSF